MIELTHSTYNLTAEELNTSIKGLNQLLDRDDIGFFDLPARTEMWAQIAKHSKFLSSNFNQLNVIGIGGSSLGGKAISDFFKYKYPDKKIEFFDNVDAYDFINRIEGFSNLAKHHWLLISKSGTTVESLTVASLVADYLCKKAIKFTEKSTVVTSFCANPLYNWAQTNNVPIFELDGDIGGRFSVLTPVGLIVAGFLGCDLEALRRGAESAISDKQLIGKLAALSLKSFSDKKWITLFWVYNEMLKTYGLWAQQLWAESLAKAQNRKGKQGPRVSSPFMCVGSSDQHSILQQVAEGERDKFIWFIRLKEAEDYGKPLGQSLFPEQKLMEHKNLGRLMSAMAQATRDSLAESGVPSLELSVSELSEGSLGYLFMLLELVVGTMGEVLDIDAFNQPGVEAGKVLAKKLLSSS